MSGFSAFLSFGLVLIILIMIMINLFSREYSTLILKNNRESTNAIISLLENSFTDIETNLKREADRAIIVSTVMNPNSTRYYIADYLSEIKPGPYTGSTHLLSYDFELIDETENQNSKLFDTEWIDEEKASITLLDKHLGVVALSNPVKYNGLTEGYLLYIFNFSEIFFETIELLGSLGNYEHQLKIYYGEKELLSSNRLSINNLTYRQELQSIPLTVEILTPTSYIETIVNRITGNLIVITTVFAIFAIILLSFFTSFLITYPLKRLSRDIERSAYSSSEIVSFNRRTANEIITVGKAFNTLHQKLLRRSELIELSNRELQSTQAQLVQNEKMASLGQLAAGVAHEINNPTGFVKNNIETLKEYNHIFGELLELIKPVLEKREMTKQELDSFITQLLTINSKDDLGFIHDDIHPLIDETLDGVDRIQKIVQGLRNFARQDNEVFNLGNINHAIDNAITLTRNEIKYHCRVDTNLDELSDVMCNIDQLTQVFVNLLINASHAIKGHGRIYISSKERKGHIIVKIADNGIGIAPEYIPRLFDPFFSTKAVGKGTGLGLSISKGIIEKHQGIITVISRPGRGSSFTVKIPIKKQL